MRHWSQDVNEEEKSMTSESFKLLQLDANEWLESPLSQWDTSREYVAFQQFVRSLRVTNGTAEHGVTLHTEYQAWSPNMNSNFSCFCRLKKAIARNLCQLRDKYDVI